MVNSQIHILYHDKNFIVVDKPAGFHVHPHDQIRCQVPREKVCLYAVRDKLKQRIYPVHRLDAGTSGVLLFALSPDSARTLCQLFSKREIKKTYHAVVRGFVPAEAQINLELPSDSSGGLVDAQTSYRRLATVDLPFAVGKKFSSSRYSLVEVCPLTGRWHQIRRHFNRISHPLLGDGEHGDTRHNQVFREKLGISGLCLKAQRIEFLHPWTREAFSIESPTCDRWKQIRNLFKVPL